MQIVVLNGSPKGLTSVTVQYVWFLQKQAPDDAFTLLHVSQDCKDWEADTPAFQAALRTVAGAEMVLWATPVYVFAVPGPYKRFVELVLKRGGQAAFHDKYAAILTTSVRFFDHVAQSYLHGVSEDLGMRLAGTYSAAMYDLLQPEEQRRLTAFWADCRAIVAEKRPVQRAFIPVCPSSFSYAPGPPPTRISTAGRKVAIVTDADPGGNLEKMVARVAQGLDGPLEVINLQAIRIRGGCLGCLQCGLDNQCVYRDADDVRGAYEKLVAADIVIQAATIQDRFLSARWKTFWDRGFFNNHVPLLPGKQVGYLVAGPLQQLSHLRDVLQASLQIQRANLAGIVTDECRTSAELDDLLQDFVRNLLACDRAGTARPPTFLGIAGHKILRDEIWASLRFVFPRDHAYYRRHGLYDFPRRSLRTRLQEALVRLLLHLPGFRRTFRRRIRTEMIKPLAKVVEAGGTPPVKDSETGNPTF